MKKRWRELFSLRRYFGCHRHSSRISHAVLVPDPLLTHRTSDAAATGIARHASSEITFTAPPSSPSSFVQLAPESLSMSHMPDGLLSLSARYLSGSPASIFATGPYASETQLVSPPVFSAFTTEPSTAPLTPPPETVHFTTPSSPEVPFAKLLSSASIINSTMGEPHRSPHLLERSVLEHFNAKSWSGSISGLSTEGDGETADTLECWKRHLAVGRTRFPSYPSRAGDR